MNKHAFISALGAAFCFLLVTGTAWAQGPGSTGPTPPPVVPSPTGVPIDGGASLLLAAGGAYALKRLRGQREKK